jgi:DNA-binding IclR family transcriptional regulator
MNASSRKQPVPKQAAAPEDLSRYTVPALARGLQLLGYFTRDQRELSGAHLAHFTGWPRASVFRMLQTLEQAGFIERCGEGPIYRLSIAVLRLGFEYLAGQELAELGQPILEALRDRSGYSAHLAIRDGRDAVFIAKAAISSTQFHSIQVGARLPVHTTALGRALLGGITMADLVALYAGQALTRYTASTPATLEALKAQVDADAQYGYNVCQGGFEAGVSSIAAPVLDGQKKICAAINITVLASRIETTAMPALIDHVRHAAHTLTRRICHLPSSNRY